MIIDLGLKIRTLRTKQNLTQKQLAAMACVAPRTIYTYESGNRYPSYGVLISFARIFHVSTDYLLGLKRIQTIDVSDLNEQEINIVLQVIDLLKNRK